MNRSEAAQLLGVLAAYDRRTVGDPDVLAWACALDDLRLTDAMDAVHQHYRTSSEWLDPNHVRRLVKAVRADRLERAPHLTPPAHLADRPEEQNEWLRRARRLIADGVDPDTVAKWGAVDGTPTRALPEMGTAFHKID